MILSKCRVCKNKLDKKPLLQYQNLPRAAQYLPDKQSLKNDKGINLEIYQCSGCGLVQLNNKPVSYYKQVVRAAGISSEMKAFRLNQFSSFTKKYNLKNKKVIEVGCGRGEYLTLIKQCVADAYGLEHSRESVNYCVNNNLKVTAGFIKNESYKLSSEPFAAFFILSFLEHLPHPNKILKGIRNNLSDNAVGLVEVPNFDMILQKKLFSEFIVDHLFYFTKDTLKSTLMINGFDILECNEIWHDYIISATVKKKTKLNISHFYKHQMKIKNDIEKYINLFKDKKVAIWGAGHQALTIMSLANLTGKVKYVIDSAPFKQGKYTPATHIPIVAPDVLNSNPVEAIIVIAGSYSDEVAKIIRQKYNKKINIAILRDFGLEVI